ncbi:MAG: Fe-S cluster assembly protein SufD [Chloroflexi bacterium]|nr:Fe-S cluster assembly protein SufD [Chloroflexota bacterium]
MVMTQAPTKHDRYLADFEGFERDVAARGPEWLHELRQRALARFTEVGFPTARRGNERWKYTNINPIAEGTFSYPFAAGEVDGERLHTSIPWSDDWSRLVFVNGLHSAALSSVGVGADARSLAEALRADGQPAREHLGRYVTIEDDAFAALNTAFVHDGALVHVPKNGSLDRPLHLVYVTAAGAGPTVSYPRTLVVAESHSRLTLIETYAGFGEGRYFTDAVTEIVLGEGAQVQHYRVLMEEPDAFHVGITRVHLERDSTFTSTLFARGCAIGRNDLLATLDAPGSSCFLRGLYLTSGSQHVDNYVNIDHTQPHTTSRLYYKGILGGKSHAVFGGTVFVRPGAVKADARQEDKNLLLSDEAEVDSKPSLEIYADDVLCGHGATAGTVADDALFYMRTRGLDLNTAMVHLIKGFASEVLDKVEVEPLRLSLDRLTTASLPELQPGLVS